MERNIKALSLSLATVCCAYLMCVVCAVLLPRIAKGLCVPDGYRHRFLKAIPSFQIWFPHGNSSSRPTIMMTALRKCECPSICATQSLQICRPTITWSSSLIFLLILYEPVIGRSIKLHIAVCPESKNPVWVIYHKGDEALREFMLSRPTNRSELLGTPKLDPAKIGQRPRPVVIGPYHQQLSIICIGFFIYIPYCDRHGCQTWCYAWDAAPAMISCPWKYSVCTCERMQHTIDVISHSE